jgi:hypothetical protein
MLNHLLVQFQQDVSWARRSLVQARTVPRPLLGYQTAPEAFERRDLSGLGRWGA